MDNATLVGNRNILSQTSHLLDELYFELRDRYLSLEERVEKQFQHEVDKKVYQTTFCTKCANFVPKTGGCKQIEFALKNAEAFGFEPNHTRVILQTPEGGAIISRRVSPMSRNGTITVTCQPEKRKYGKK